MIPLINVVFLMLAFFVLAGQIEAHQRKLNVPKSSSEIERSSDPQVLTIYADGSLEIEGQVVSQEELGIVLRQRTSTQRQEIPSAVLVEADSDLLVSDLQAVLTELREARITKVNLATLPVKG